MFRSARVLSVFFFSLTATINILAQQPQPVQMASLRPAPGLHWQRISPTQQHSDGPVLYQLVFTPGTPGAIAKFDTNARHLVSSDISDVGGIVAIGGSGFAINVSTGIINFVNEQTFPNAITSIASGPGLTGGPITSSGTLSLDTNFTNNLYAQLAAANTFTTGTQLVQTGAAGTVGLAVQGASAQTANLEEWRNNAGGAMASISAGGKFSGDGSALTNLSNNQIVDGTLRQRKAALMQWYRQDFAIPNGPIAIAFDGVNIWVTNNLFRTVTKLRASDSTALGTFLVGFDPLGVAFDGSNIWVVNGSGNNVTKLRASDGANLGTFVAGSNPEAVAFDGANIWVTNFGGNTVTKLRASDGANLGAFSVGAFPTAVAFDGANVWVTNFNSNNVTKLRASDGANLGTFSVGTNPEGIAFDGANIWVTNAGSNNVTELHASDGAPLGTFATGSSPEGVAFDGANLWIANNLGNSITKLRAMDGANLGTFTTAAGPTGVAFDGANIWVANYTANSISKF
ncbi:MAG TPA: hypothetical protein VK738_09280 [Terriglobales bacterium]|jgi:outer membrane lipoprotein-sorting protein|nr:hypothetical protein [Terriglobales bacterium]